jgi:hypothetical protein
MYGRPTKARKIVQARLEALKGAKGKILWNTDKGRDIYTEEYNIWIRSKKARNLKKFSRISRIMEHYYREERKRSRN